MSFLSLTYEVLHISTNFHLPHSLNLEDGGGGGGGESFSSGYRKYVGHLRVKLLYYSRIILTLFMVMRHNCLFSVS